jgi:hypothetical protein
MTRSRLSFSSKKGLTSAIRADGAYHPISDDPYIDMLAVKIVDTRHFEWNFQKNGKLVGTYQFELSADGNTTTETISDSTASPTPVTGKMVFERVASAPPGSLPSRVRGVWSRRRAFLTTASRLRLRPRVTACT